MPYLKKEKTEDIMFEWGLARLLNNIRFNSAGLGELNYIITSILINYFEYKNLNYSNLCEIRGVLQDVSDEFYRRVVSVYEDQKKEQNIDPYYILLNDKIKKS